MTTKDELYNTSKEQDNKPQAQKSGDAAGSGAAKTHAPPAPKAPGLHPPAPRPPGMPPMMAAPPKATPPVETKPKDKE
jgi:hypothetical protein